MSGQVARASAAIGSVVIRRAIKVDKEKISSLAKLLFPNSSLVEEEGDVFLIAEYEGKPAGFCHFRFRARSCFISGLGVLPEFRNHGLGTLLLSYALDIIDRSGAQATFLKVRAINPASNLYVRFGFFEKRAGDTVVLERKKPS